MNVVTVAELRAAVDDDAYVVDVREPVEFAGGHVPGARLVPLATVPAALPELPRDRTIYVVCEVGARSERAALFLVRHGFDARNVAGGTRAWASAGYPVEY